MSNKANDRMTGGIRAKIGAEWRKIQSMKGKERRGYIWDYYKIPIIGTIIGVWIVGSIINDTIINPPPRSALTIAWMTGFEHEYRLDALSQILSPFILEEYSRETVQVQSFITGGDPQINMAMNQRFTAMSAANELDIIIGNVIERDDGIITIGLAPTMAFQDIRPLLEEAGVFADTDNLLFDNMIFDENEEEVTVAVAVYLDEIAAFDEAGIDTEGLFLGVMVNSRRDEAVLKAIQVLMAGYYG